MLFVCNASVKWETCPLRCSVIHHSMAVNARFYVFYMYLSCCMKFCFYSFCVVCRKVSLICEGSVLKYCRSLFDVLFILCCMYFVSLDVGLYWGFVGHNTILLFFLNKIHKGFIKLETRCVM